MKVARNYVIGGSVVVPPIIIDPIPTDPTPTNPASTIVTLKVNLANATTPTTSFATMKYNKKGGLMMVKDDGGIEDYTIGYAYLKGGFPAKDGVTYPGVYYTDGTGKQLAYKITSALNTNKDPNITAFGLNTWENRKLMLDTVGWEMANHSFDHGYFDRYQDIKEAEKIIYGKTGMRTRALVVPTNDEGYATASLSLGYSIVGTAGAFDDFPDNRQTADGKGVYWGGILNTRTFNYRQLLFNRYYAGEGGVNDLADMYTLVNTVLAGAKNNTAHNMAHWFHHGLNDASNQNRFEIWKALIQYIKNHPDNNDALWIAGMQEFTEYYETKDKVVKTESRSGNVLTVTLDLSAVPQENRLRDMSLLVSGGNISSIEVEGANSHSFNPATGLINLYVKNPNVKSPFADVVPPRITSAVRSGNAINLTYDRAITQTVFSSSAGAAYTVDGNTVSNVTGSGTSWKINCTNAVASGAKFNYRMQRGNAAGTDGAKVCSYIGYPTT
jgi:hypothetical protein